jgi:hypothetical protein
MRLAPAAVALYLLAWIFKPEVHHRDTESTEQTNTDQQR